MYREKERTWLLDEPPRGVRALPGERIEQGYLAVDPDGAEVRLLRRAGRSKLTAERSGGSEPRHVEIALTDAQFDNLWRATEGSRLVKVRYRWLVPARDRVAADVDVYDGDLKGLVTVRVSFTSKELGGKFRPLQVFGREVTRDSRYHDRSLAREGRPE